MPKAGQQEAKTNKPPRRTRGQRLELEQRREVQSVFLQAFSHTGIILRGLEAAEMNRSTLDWWLEHDEEFSLLYGIARREADDVLRSVVYQRGVEGRMVTKLIKRRSKNGRMVLDREETQQQVSDSMLQLLVRSRLPEFRPDSTVRVELDQNMIALIIDVLVRHVTDDLTLERIANDLAALVTTTDA